MFLFATNLAQCPAEGPTTEGECQACCEASKHPFAKFDDKCWCTDLDSISPADMIMEEAAPNLCCHTCKAKGSKWKDGGMQMIDGKLYCTCISPWSGDRSIDFGP
eukprot:NODE_515_length_770_cov_367.009331_g506_i0.p1 GENE.NODE_515_length_770_cov_367.009331_g506_i0~~NODE_515_length_770_cov_367.009331_g506_i0.p1  ORF type:complete len:105 (+),score=17.52 NODE_515_length_770_cov_367.009331_g506_i0:77-391(+)